MGGILSSLLGGPAAAEAASSSEPSQVRSFHSSERWQLHFNEVKESNKLVVIDFSATWCGPCKLMEPIFNALSSKFTDVDFVKIDVDELSAMPTFVLVKKGKEVDRLIGAKKEELEKKIEKHRPTA
ncbi:hypothetical protein FEM48_Zijuj04G0038900 [Ziziphus jujuba var. spinosa]|uniref:Thioredoxin domain-containing protein n=1 Tax=Ziziphus jujuba var. spinosa TaxID=714518 RepID=A0A978VHN4_ZIZJJ|nr:hypothetical protein FEM48_Zijuj04G0038900 [Ziziphus jujuba var. spinosa]